MPAFLNRYEGLIYAAFRIMFGLLFVQHGLQKIFGLFGGTSGQMPAPLLYTAGAVELVGGACVAAGLQARWAAFLCSGTMAVAYFMVHASNGFFPILNRGEMAILYCFGFLLIAARGAGKLSLDDAMGTR